MSDIRTRGKNALEMVLKNKQNIDIFENNIYKLSKDDEEYLWIIYQIIGDISHGVKLKELLTQVKNRKINWDHPFYEDMINDEIEQDNFIMNPFEIQEGVIECKCGSNRVFSFQKQCRGADETATTFAECAACGNKWVYSG